MPPKLSNDQLDLIWLGFRHGQCDAVCAEDLHWPAHQRRVTFDRVLLLLKRMLRSPGHLQQLEVMATLHSEFWVQVEVQGSAELYHALSQHLLDLREDIADEYLASQENCFLIGELLAHGRRIPTAQGERRDTPDAVSVNTRDLIADAFSESFDPSKCALQSVVFRDESALRVLLSGVGLEIGDVLSQGVANDNQMISRGARPRYAWPFDFWESVEVALRGLAESAPYLGVVIEGGRVTRMGAEWNGKGFICQPRHQRLLEIYLQNGEEFTSASTIDARWSEIGSDDASGKSQARNQVNTFLRRNLLVIGLDLQGRPPGRPAAWRIYPVES